MSDPPVKRYRREPSPKSDLEGSDDDDGYVPYVSVAERRRQQLIKLGRAPDPRVDRLREEEGGTSSGANSDSEGVVSLQGKNSALDTQEKVQREELELIKGVSLLEQHKELQEVAEEKKETMAEKQKKEEEILARFGKATALKGVAKLATCVVYTESIKTSWKAPCFDKTGTIMDGGTWGAVATEARDMEVELIPQLDGSADIDTHCELCHHPFNGKYKTRRKQDHQIKQHFRNYFRGLSIEKDSEGFFCCPCPLRVILITASMITLMRRLSPRQLRTSKTQWTISPGHSCTEE